MRRNKRFIEISLKNYLPYLPFVLFTSVFIVGLLIGCLVVGNFEGLNEFSAEIFNNFITNCKDTSYFVKFFAFVLRIIPLYVFVFLSGTSIVGSVCVPFALSCVGFFYGIQVGRLYFTLKLEGVMFNCLVYMPSTIFLVFGLILLSIEAFKFSISLSGICIKSNKPINIYSNFKAYCFKAVLTLVFLLIGIILEIILSNLFINYFNFI